MRAFSRSFTGQEKMQPLSCQRSAAGQMATGAACLLPTTTLDRGVKLLGHAHALDALFSRRKRSPTMPTFHTRDALVEDLNVLKWINILVPKAADAVNKIADHREEKDRLEREARKRKQEELLAMADALAAAAGGI